MSYISDLGPINYQICDWCGRGANLADQRLGILQYFKPSYFKNRYWCHLVCIEKSIKAVDGNQ